MGWGGGSFPLSTQSKVSLLFSYESFSKYDSEHQHYLYDVHGINVIITFNFLHEVNVIIVF